MNNKDHDLWALIDARDKTIHRLQRDVRTLSEQVYELEQRVSASEQATEQLRQDLKLHKNELSVVRVHNGHLLKYRRLILALVPMPWLAKRLYIFFKPRLGWLSQYAARPLSVTSSKPRRLPDNPKKISIVTPSYAQGGYIEETIRSVLDQNYPALEYFVQDGGSKDQTVDVLQRYEHVLAGWSSEKDSGQSEAINLGFARTTGELMGWLNSDDILLPGSLASVAVFFDRHPNVDVVYGNRLLIDESSMEIGRWIMPGHRSDILSWADYVPQETMFWRRSIWEKAGGRIDENYRFAMDWDLLIRFRDAGAKFAHIPRFLGAFRIHEHQKTSAEISEIGFGEMDKIRARTLGYVPKRSEIRKALSGFLLQHLVVDIAYRLRARYFR